MLEQVCGCGNVCDLCDEIDPSRNYMRLWRIAASCARAPPLSLSLARKKCLFTHAFSDEHY